MPPLTPPPDFTPLAAIASADAILIAAPLLLLAASCQSWLIRCRFIDAAIDMAFIAATLPYCWLMLMMTLMPPLPANTDWLATAAIISRRFSLIRFRCFR